MICLMTTLRYRLASVVAASVAAMACIGMVGCSGGIDSTPVSPAKTLVTAQGRIMGGQQPVQGSTIQLYTVGTGGSASASKALIASSIVTSDGSGLGGNLSNAFNTLPAGEFTITNTYSCSSATEVYITATGGNAGSGNNTGLELMAAIGPCSTLTPTSFLTINELTTVAATYALAPFMADAAHVGAVGSNSIGLVNAFNMASTLVSLQTGAVATAASGVGVPTARLDTIADILAACVNATSSSASACTTLDAATGATDTLDAGLAIAKNSGSAAVTALFSLVSGMSPFTPVLSKQPNDFSIAVTYTGSEIASPGGLAIDSSGNGWITNEGGFSVVKLPSFSPAFTTTAYTNGNLISPRGISIDRLGNVWIANTGGNTVVELNSAGTALSSTGFTGGGLSAPVAIANDSAGNAWVANSSGNSISEFNSSGQPTSASPITGGGVLGTPSAIALSSTGQIAVANAATGQLCLFSHTAVLQSCASDGFLFGSTGVSISSTGNVAMAGSTTGAAVAGAFTLATTSGAVNAASPTQGGGLTQPSAVAYDGNGTAWFANSTSISAFSGVSAITPTAGLGMLSAPVAIAIDPSGNVWTANSGDNSVAVFVGLASPMSTPLAFQAGP
jgi:streptogramin lyase